jgi:hypothetical protein
MPQDGRQRRRRWLRPILIGSVVLLLLGFPAWIIWGAFFPHTYDPGTGSTRDDVTRLTRVPPPPEAADFRVASYDYGQARLVFVRFSAPVDACRKYAAAVMPKATLNPLTRDQKYDDLATIYGGSEQLHDLRWFDLPHAQGNWTAASGDPAFSQPSNDNIPETPEMIGADERTETQGYLQTSVRVDVARGVFYLLRVN